MEISQIISIMMQEHNYENGLNKYQGHGIKIKGQGDLQTNNPSFSTKKIEVHEYIATHDSKLTILINYLNITPHSRSRININGQGQYKNDGGNDPGFTIITTDVSEITCIQKINWGYSLLKDYPKVTMKGQGQY